MSTASAFTFRREIAGLHLNYESAKEFPLKQQENKAVKLDWRVEAMKLSALGRAYSRAVVASLWRARAGSSAASPR